MAEHGAHLTSGSVIDTNRPSVFEVLAQESLMSTIRPALLHLVRVFSERYPEQLGRLLRNFDEIFLLFNTMVQTYYLKKYGGSFAENFYGLKRVPSGSSNQPLLPKHRLIAVACLVLIPYSRQKLDSLFETLQYKEGSGHKWSFLQRNIPMRQRLISLYMSVYPYVRSAWEFVTLVYLLSYILRGGRWHSPSMHLSGTELCRLGPDEESNGSETLQSPAWSDMGATAKLERLTKLSLNTAAACLSTGLSVGVFFLQFLDWWYASDNSAPSLTALPIPQPPQKEKLKDVDCTSCPLCLRFRINSTALAVSGFVFCYSCISEHVKKEKCCPITGYPATAEHLVRIYEQDV